MIYVLLDLNSEGRPRGIAHIDFVSQESAVATVDSAAQEPIHLAGRDLRIDFAAGVRQQRATVEPSEKLYFSGLLGEESDIRAVFQQFDDSLVDIHLSVFFTLSDFVSMYSHRIMFNSEKPSNRRTQPNWFPSIHKHPGRYRGVGGP